MTVVGEKKSKSHHPLCSVEIREVKELASSRATASSLKRWALGPRTTQHACRRHCQAMHGTR